jgi:excisionase family DNA binding protein
MVRQTQVGVRKNPAPSPRQHGLRFVVDTNLANASDRETLPTQESPGIDTRSNILRLPTHAAPLHAATAEEASDDSHLLTVSEVAHLLQVPVSWIYARTRQRNKDRLPGYRLGKYWRFDRGEVLGWVESHRRDPHAA